MFKVSNLSVKKGGRQILNDISFSLKKGDILVLMGPNGSGKSTLARAIIGLDKHSGQVSRQDPPAVFLTFQEPPAISGLLISDFLRALLPNLPLPDFYDKLEKALKTVGLPDTYADRELNVGFSGGEKKKLEMLQLLMLDPEIAIFDEIDSGLDVDAVRIIANAFKKWFSPEKSAIIITHNSRLIKRLKPNKVAILNRGRIIKTGDYSLAETTLKEGFNEETSN